MNILKDLESYFKKTPKEQIELDWKKTEKYDKSGVLVKDFLNLTEMSNRLDKVLEKETKKSLTKWLSQKRKKRQNKKNQINFI